VHILKQNQINSITYLYVRASEVKNAFDPRVSKPIIICLKKTIT
jgi:hypothetical protein